MDLARPDEIELYRDRERLLSETDPHSRQIVTCPGTLLELLVLAEHGVNTEVAAFPDREPGARLGLRPVARVTLRRDAALRQDPLFARVLARRSDEVRYDGSRCHPTPWMACALPGPGEARSRV